MVRIAATNASTFYSRVPARASTAQWVGWFLGTVLHPGHENCWRVNAGYTWARDITEIIMTAEVNRIWRGKNAGSSPASELRMIAFLPGDHHLISNKQANTYNDNGCNHIENYFTRGRWQLLPTISTPGSMVVRIGVTRWRVSVCRGVGSKIKPDFGSFFLFAVRTMVIGNSFETFRAGSHRNTFWREWNNNKTVYFIFYRFYLVPCCAQASVFFAFLRRNFYFYKSCCYYQSPFLVGVLLAISRD